MRRILLLFMLVLLVFTSIGYADSYHYDIVVFPGPGETSIVFSDINTYNVQYNGAYNIIVPEQIVYEIIINNPTNNDLSDYTVSISLDSWFQDWDYNSSDMYFVDEYGNFLYYYFDVYDPSQHRGHVYVKLNLIKANSNLTMYMIVDPNNPYTNNFNNPYEVYLAYAQFNGDLDPGWVVKKSGTAPDPTFTATEARIYGTFSPSGGATIFEFQSVSSITRNILITYRVKPISSSVSAGNVNIFRDNFMHADGRTYYVFYRGTGYWAISYWSSSEGAHELTSTSAPWNVYYIVSVKIDIVDKKAYVSVKREDTNQYVINNYPVSFTDLSSVYLGVGVYNYYSSSVTVDGYIDYYIARSYIDSGPYVVKTIRLGKTGSIGVINSSSNGLYSLMASRYKSWFGLCNSESCPVRIVYDSGFTFWIGSNQIGGGDIGYDNDYFLYRIYFDDSWHFIINDFYTGQYLSKDTGDTSVFSFNETYITEPYLFYIVFAPYKSDYVVVHIRAPPNYYVDNVTVQYMYAYYQNDNVYIWFEGNDAYIKLGYANYYNAYYPLIIRFNLYVGDLPDRNTYDASRDPYADNPPPSGSDSSSGSSGSSGNGGGGSFWGYQAPSSSFNGTLDIPGGSLFPQFLLNAMLFAAIFLPSVFLYRRYWFFPVMVGLLVLSRIGYVFFYVPIVVFTIFVVTMFLREYIAEEYSLLVGLIMGYFMNVFIISGNQKYAPEPPSNPLEVPSYLNDLLTKAITFSYLPSPFNTIMTIFFVSLVVFAVIRLIVRIIRGV